ncbi:MAG: PIN domain-containing protein, partial [Myxococcaceae bacterium]
MKKIYLDTHTAIFLYAGLEEKLPHNILELLKNHQVLISPIVELEIQYLYEIGRITEPSVEILTALLNQIGLEVSPLSFGQVVHQALKESWTRDLFDRIIVSQA